MEIPDLILAEDFCINNRIEVSFVNSLVNFGLINTIIVDEAQYVELDEVKKLEQLMRLHYELQINFEGLDVVSYLLNKMVGLQNELSVLKTQLSTELTAFEIVREAEIIG